jgi:hypothetical protein
MFEQTIDNRYNGSCSVDAINLFFLVAKFAIQFQVSLMFVSKA